VVRKLSISSEFRKELSQNEIGKTINFCYQCGTCSGICPALRYTGTFNPRRIIENSLLGFKDKLINGPMIWNCTTCHSCLEVCPQAVRVSEIMFQLKNLAVKIGNLPENFRMEGQNVATTGMNIPSSAAISRRRAQLKLPEVVHNPNVEDYKKICEATGFFDLIKEPEKKEEV